MADNVIQADDRGSNTWNAAYPTGGNMWSDYLGQDKMSGPGQDAPGSDRIGDVPYKINDQSADKYPLMGNPGSAYQDYRKEHRSSFDHCGQ